MTEFLAKPSGENVVKSAPKKRKAAKGKKKKGKKGKKGPKKPRAPSAYILFCKVARPKVVEEEPDLGSTEIMTKMGAMWKALSDDEQGKYKKQSAALKAEMEGGAAEASEEEAEESEEEGSDEE